VRRSITVGFSIVEVLEQTSIWREQDGRTYYVGELDDDYLGNIIAYLNRHADELLQRRRDVDEFDEPPRSIDHIRYLESVDALTWLHDRPLYRRLLAEQRRRSSVDGWVVQDALGIEQSHE
jgi:hypothetical protein